MLHSPGSQLREMSLFHCPVGAVSAVHLGEASQLRAASVESQAFSTRLPAVWMMTGYTATVTVRLKQGVLDPEAKTTERALERLGFELSELRAADVFEIDIEADSPGAARERVTEMTERLLANPTLHDYEIEVESQ